MLTTPVRIRRWCRIQADAEDFHQRKRIRMSVLTLLTVQNTRSVDAVEPLAPGFVLAQLDSCGGHPTARGKTLARSYPQIIERLLGARPTFLFLW